MSGTYIRKRIPGATCDPTMSYVDDPHGLHVGDYIRIAAGWRRITQIDEAQLNNPDIRFAHTVEERPPIGRAIVHDLREKRTG